MKSKTDMNTGEVVCSEELARELLDIHLFYSKQISQLAAILAATGEYGILFCLYMKKECMSPGDLAEAVGLTPGRITNLLNALEKKGRVTRERCPEDKRKTFVSLTDEGSRYICDMYNTTQQYYQNLVERIGEEDIREFIRITRSIFDAAKEIAEE